MRNIYSAEKTIRASSSLTNWRLALSSGVFCDCSIAAAPKICRVGWSF